MQYSEITGIDNTYFVGQKPRPIVGPGCRVGLAGQRLAHYLLPLDGRYNLLRFFVAIRLHLGHLSFFMSSTEKGWGDLYYNALQNRFYVATASRAS